MEQTRRQAFAVTSRLQYRFLTMTLIYCFILISLVMVAFLVPDVLEMNNSNLNPEIRAAAAERLLEKHGWAWPPVVPLLALIGLISFREFKKVAGPLYRFRWAFEQLEKGNLLSSVKIRKKDYLIDECLHRLSENIA